MPDNDFVYDEDSVEWLSASEHAERRREAAQVEVRNAVGNALADEDQVTLIKDLEVGAQVSPCAPSSSASADRDPCRRAQL